MGIWQPCWLHQEKDRRIHLVQWKIQNIDCYGKNKKQETNKTGEESRWSNTILFTVPSIPPRSETFFQNLEENVRLAATKNLKRGYSNNIEEANSIVSNSVGTIINDKNKDNKKKVNFGEAEAFFDPGTKNTDSDPKLYRIDSLKP